MNALLRSAVSLVAIIACTAANAQSVSRSTLNAYNNNNIVDNPNGAITGQIINSMNQQIINAMGVQADSNFWTGANTFSGPSSFTNIVNITPPSPAWGTNYGVFNGVLSNVNNFPATGIFTNGNFGSTPNASALTGAILVPANDLTTFITAGVTGLIANESGNPGVGLFGWCVQLNGTYTAQCWGANFGSTNAATIGAPTNTGQDMHVIYGAEADINVYKKAGGVTPAGAARGFAIFSGSEVVPTGGAVGLEIGAYSQAGIVGWTAAITIDDGPSTAGIQIGRAGVTGNNLGSQSIIFDTISSGGVAGQDSILADANADMIVNTPAASVFGVTQNLVKEFTVGSGVMDQYSTSGSFFTQYLTDSSGNTVIRSGDTASVISLQNSVGTALATIGNPTPGTATKTLVADSSGNWFSQAGFTGTKTAGSCALTIVAGAITAVSGC